MTQLQYSKAHITYLKFSKADVIRLHYSKAHITYLQFFKTHLTQFNSIIELLFGQNLGFQNSMLIFKFEAKMSVT